MHLVVDAVAVQQGSSAIVIEHLLHGWDDLGTGDVVTVVAPPGGVPFRLPSCATEVRLPAGLPGGVGSLWRRTGGVRRAVRRLKPSAVLAGVPASGLFGYGRAPRGLILYDLRHELRPHQFSWRQRLARRVSWGWTMWRADGIYTISHRTLADLRSGHPRLARRGVASPLGADHVDSWPAAQREEPPYALAFGHFANKNADAVIRAWARFCEQNEKWRLLLVGMGTTDRESASELISRLGVSDRIDLAPWLDDERFRTRFAGASLVVFPSDFEGFGLPAVEAMRLGIPVVISDDPALAEVTGGHAVTAASTAPDDLADAIRRAVELDVAKLGAARRHTDSLRWRDTAAIVRAGLLKAGQPDPDDGRR